MDNSQTRKEGVSYTYKGYDGYAPIAAYLGQEGWCLGCELRPCQQHSSLTAFHQPRLSVFHQFSVSGF